MDKRRIFMESVSQLGLNELQFKGVVSLFEACQDEWKDPNYDEVNNIDWWEYDEQEAEERDPAKDKAYEEVKALFVPVNGKRSQMASKFSRYWKNKFMSYGIVITKIKEWDPEDDNFPKLYVSFRADSGDGVPGNVDIRADSDGRLSFVIRNTEDRYDPRAKNMNPYIYQFEGEDISKFEDHYEFSPKYTINQLKEMFDEVTERVHTYCVMQEFFSGF